MTDVPTPAHSTGPADSTDYAALVARLRRRNGDGDNRVIQPDVLADQAAAAITALVRERDEARKEAQAFLFVPVERVAESRADAVDAANARAIALLPELVDKLREIARIGHPSIASDYFRAPGIARAVLAKLDAETTDE